jgi:hypothetical protein
LDTYYRGLSDTPVAGEKNSDKMKFILWFRRRISDRPGSAFVADLSAKTGVTATAPGGHDGGAEDSLTAAANAQPAYGRDGFRCPLASVTS